MNYETLIAWLHASDVRMDLLAAVARANTLFGKPSQRATMRTATRNYSAKSSQSHGSQAIRDMVKEGLLTNHAPDGHPQQLAVAWDFIGILSDWLEERGRPRLDTELLRKARR